MRSISKSSFGGENEIKVVIYALKKLLDAKIESVDIVAHSRGAATTLNTLASLIEPSKNLEDSLQRLNIKQNDRVNMLDMILKGSIMLWWPLRDFKTLIEEKIDIAIDSCSPLRLFIKMPGFIDIIRSFELFWIWMPILSKNILKSFAYYTIPLVTSHKWHERTVPESIALLNKKGLKFKIMTLLQPDDLAVHNTNESHYINSLPADSSDNYVVLGGTGGHMKTDRQHKYAINTFRKKYECSYNPKNIVASLMSKTNVQKINKKHGSIENFITQYTKIDTKQRQLNLLSYYFVR